MAEVYLHRRADNNVPTYVGIGLGAGRKHEKGKRRGDWWNRINNKYGLVPEVLIDNISYEQAKQIEIMMISRYGRISDGGTLINLTDGGDGMVGYIPTESTKEKMVVAVSQFDKEGNYIRDFKSLKEAYKFHGISDSTSISKAIAGDNHTAAGFRWAYKGEELKVNNYKYKRIVQYDLEGNFVAEHFGRPEVTKNTNISYKMIERVLNGSRRQTHGFIFKYEQ